MRATREAGFGDEVKRRIILGTYALSSGYYDAYYGQAQKVRTLISRDFDAAFEQADVLVSPTAPTTAFQLGEKVDDPLAMYLNDLATIPANLSGVPGISVPSGLADEDGLPAGVQILAPALADDRVYRVGAALEALLAREWGGRLLDQAPDSVGRARRDHGGPPMSDALLSYDDVLAQFDPALGLEVHVELNTATKMFCGCPTEFGAEPNTQTCPTCLGLPGSMPVVNAKAVESAIRIGLALNCEIAEWCRFARKNYFYPDMPKNFQTCQYDEPIAFEGYMDVEVDGETYRVGIERAHMEEDTGKSLHVGGSTGRIHGADYSLVDYNRAGIPLIEIVTKPVLGTGAKAPEVARAYVAQLRELLLGLGVSDVRMEQGSLRCDVNLSLSPRRASGDARHPHRDQERQLAALGRAGGALRDAAARRGPGRRRHDPAGDPALARGHRRHHQRAREVRRRGLPLLPRARPGADGAEPGVGGRAAGDAAGAAAREAGPAPGGVGLLRPRDARHRRRRRARRWSRRRSRPVPRRQAARKWWLGELARRANESETDLASLGVTPDRRGPRPGPGRRRARSTTSSRARCFDGLLAGEGTPDEIVAARGLGDRLRRRCAGRGRRQRDRGQPRRRRQDPRRQGRRGRRADRCGDEGDARPGRRRPRPRADPREAGVGPAGNRAVRVDAWGWQ